MVKAVVGANWGDEGKGKITDMLAKQADIIVRFQGGANAGHTIVNDYGKFALHNRLWDVQNIDIQPGKLDTYGRNNADAIIPDDGNNSIHKRFLLRMKNIFNDYNISGVRQQEKRKENIM